MKHRITALRVLIGHGVPANSVQVPSRLLRVVLCPSGKTRVEGKILFGIAPWRELNLLDSFCEQLLFNYPARLIRHADGRLEQWPCHNMLPEGATYLDHSTIEAKRFLVNIYHGLDANDTYGKIRQLEDFFKVQ